MAGDAFDFVVVSAIRLSVVELATVKASLAMVVWSMPIFLKGMLIHRSINSRHVITTASYIIRYCVSISLSTLSSPTTISYQGPLII